MFVFHYFRDLNPLKFSQSTAFFLYLFSRYIHRFRNAPPSSRQARDRQYTDSGKGGEFWWLSSPPSSSTPKEGTPPERLLGPSPRPSLSPKQKRGAARRGKATVSPISVSIIRILDKPRCILYAIFPSSLKELCQAKVGSYKMLVKLRET